MQTSRPARVVSATACAGDSDEPMPSTIASTDGNAVMSASLASPDRMLPPDPRSRSDDVSQRPGSAPSAASSGRALASPTRFIAFTRSRCDEIEHIRHVDMRPVVQHDPAPAQQRAERRPLTARVHERTERQRDELRGGCLARREERAQPLRRILHHRRRDRLGRGDRWAARIPAAERGEEDVLLPPHDAFRESRRPPGVEHVVVVAAAGPEVASRRRARRFAPRTRVRRRRGRTAPLASCPAAPRTCSRTEPSCTTATQVRVVEQVGVLVRHVAGVHVDRYGPELVAREHRLDVCGGVLHAAADRGARLRRHARGARAPAASRARRARGTSRDRTCSRRRRVPVPRRRRARTGRQC